jgi:hypothetical protein
MGDASTTIASAWHLSVIEMQRRERVMAMVDRFPVLASHDERPRLEALGCPKYVPWSLLAPHEQRALRNHGGQTLKRLAERGGLGPEEMLAIIEDRPWRRMTIEESVPALLDAIKKHGGC